MKQLHGLFIVFLFSMVAGQAFAATPSQPQLRELQRQQEQIIQQQEERLRQQEDEFNRHRGAQVPREDLQKLPPVKQQEGAACMDVRDIKVTGVTLLSSGTLEKIIERYIGRCLTLADINNLLRDVTNEYIAKGYVTSRAFLAPEQSGEGNLEVLVIEGTVEKIIINDGAFNFRMRGKTAFPGLVGKPLNLRDIEQGLDQLNRLPSGNATMELEPGETLGGTVVKITYPDARTWHVNLGVDNSGQRSTGRSMYNASLTKDNFIGLGDQVAVYWSQDLPFWNHELFETRRTTGHNQSFSTYLSIPYGYWTLSANISSYRYKTTIFGMNTEYGTDGTTNAASIQLQRVIHRDADSKTALAVSMNHRVVDTYIEGFHILASSYKTTTGELSLTHSRRVWGGYLNAGLTYSHGLPWFGVNPAKEVPPSAPQSQFDKYSANLSWYRPFAVGEENFYWQFSALGQYSPQTLYSAERIQAGGRYSVRGFQDDSLTGDSGAYFRNEIGWNMPWFERLQQSESLYGVQLYAAYDFGFIHKDRRDPFERGEAQGAAIGLRTLGDVSFDITVAKALDAPSFIHKRDTEVYASLSYNF